MISSRGRLVRQMTLLFSSFLSPKVSHGVRTLTIARKLVFLNRLPMSARSVRSAVPEISVVIRLSLKSAILGFRWYALVNTLVIYWDCWLWIGDVVKLTRESNKYTLMQTGC